MTAPAWTDHECRFASPGEPLCRGVLHVAPAEHHVVIQPDATLGVPRRERVRFVRPSIDWLFESAAASFGDRAIAVVLSGANEDGADGARCIRSRRAMAKSGSHGGIRGSIPQYHMMRKNLFSGAIVLVVGSSAWSLGCATQVSETQEIVDNLAQAGFRADDIMIVNNTVYVGRDAEVSLEASREMRMADNSTEEQYRTTNLITRDMNTICIDSRQCASFSSKFSTALTNAADNYTFMPFAFDISVRSSSFTGCDAVITCRVISGVTGGSSGFPSNGRPFPAINIGSGLDSSIYSVDTVEHVMTHEIGHTIGLRHSDWFNPSISCGSGGSEGDGGVGAILIPGTPEGAVVGGSIMNSCFRTSESGEFSQSDITALLELYPPLGEQAAYIKASNTQASDSFGRSVAAFGDTLVVGVPSEDSNATGVNGNQADNSADSAGAVYVFVRTGQTWSQQAYLKGSNTGAGDNFGQSVSLYGNILVVGAPGESSSATGVNGNQADNSASRAGAVYVFFRSGTTWTQQAYLKASNTGAGDNFGSAVAVSGDSITVGAPGESSSATGLNGNQADNSAGAAGAAYVFVLSGATWIQQAYLKASNTGAFDNFGSSITMWFGTVAIGAPGEDSSATGVNGNQADNGAEAAGAVYVFARSDGTWTQKAYLKASNTEAFDSFGSSISMAGSVLAVGAPGEDSAATGFNGNQADNSASSAGAVYLFHTVGIAWVQQTYIKASTTEASDQFGTSVAMDGPMLAIGAPGEASSATGIGGNQSDNSASSAGAVHLFVRAADFGTTWSPHSYYIKASNTESLDRFGASVAVSGDTLAVAAFGEASGATGVNGNQTDNSASGAGAVYVFR